jgi:hypothetical protein
MQQQMARRAVLAVLTRPTEVKVSEAQLKMTSADPKPSRVPPHLAALLFPDTAMERVAKSGKWGFALAFALAASLALGGAEAFRVDAREPTLREAEISGQLKNLSDKQLDDNTKAAERSFIVKRLAASVVKPELLLLGSLLGLYVVAWFLRGRASSTAVTAVAGASLLPHALADLLSAGAALVTSQLSPEHGPLIPRNLGAVFDALGVHAPMAALKLATAVDFFSLWAALLLAFGLGPAAQLPRGKAIAATLVAWLLWRLFTQVALGG